MPKYHILKLVSPLPGLQDGAPKTLYVRQTTEHSASSYGQPVIVDNHGNLWDLLSLGAYADTGRTKTINEEERTTNIITKTEVFKSNIGEKAGKFSIYGNAE